MMLVDFPLEDGDSMIAGVGDQQTDRDTVVRRHLCSDRSIPRLERQLPGFEDFLGWKCDKASSV